MSDETKRTMKNTIAILFLCCLNAFATPAFTRDNIVAAIVGEAAGQPYRTKLDVACAIRNRATLDGVYGVNAKHNKAEPDWVWNDARRAWGESFHRDTTFGATHFGNSDDVAKGTFAGMRLTHVSGDGKDKIFFFKKVSQRTPPPSRLERRQKP